jgi:prevent-host-death family protein
VKTATISEAKNRLSALVDRVRAGETVVILDRSTPVARLVPVRGSKRDPLADEAGLKRLERAGLIRRGTGRLPAGFFRRRRPRPSAGASAVAALLAERREGR